MTGLIRALRRFLQNPGAVLVMAGGVTFAAVLMDGTLFRIWSLDRDRDRQEARIESLKASILQKEKALRESSRAEFIEKQVRDRLDFVRDGDLVFVFPDDSEGNLELKN